MSDVTVTLDLRDLDEQTDRALKGVAVRAGQRTQQQMQARRWAWPRTTPRQNGSLAGTTRNIVDEGRLRDSQTDPRRVAPHTYQIDWTAPYAAAVFLGAVFRKRSGSLPARNAPLAAIRGMNLASDFARAWRQP